MRVISGYLGGRTFDSPGGHRTHPMSDKIRGALFNTLGDIKSLTVLDCYGGSGAVAFEAVSRGAASAITIELDKIAQKTIHRNVTSLGLEETVTLKPMGCLGWSMRNQTKTFDVVICDPPYDRVLMKDIQKLSKHVTKGGILALSWPVHVKADEIEGFAKLKSARYGEATLHYYRKI